jgi:hypothetical protein
MSMQERARTLDGESRTFCANPQLRTLALTLAISALAVPSMAAGHKPADAGFESSYEAIVAAAEKEPALHFCQTFSREE